MRNPWQSTRRRLALLGVAAALTLAPIATATAATPTSSATVSGSHRAAAVQAVLDRVLGPGNAVVTVSDTIQTSTMASTSVSWGTGVAGSSAATLTTVAGATTSKSITQQNLVGGTSTATVTPPGSLVRQSVAVAVDRAHIGTRSLASLKHLVASAAGIARSRGDSLSLVVLPFAKPAAAVAPVSPSAVSVLMPYAEPAFWGIGGVLAAVILALIFGGRSKRSTELVRR